MRGERHKSSGTTLGFSTGLEDDSRWNAVAILARYGRHLAGAWRRIYAVSAAIALHLNVFVLIVQAFLKVPALKAMAPTQSEPPFVVAQITVLVFFAVLTIFAAIKFRVEPVRPA